MVLYIISLPPSPHLLCISFTRDAYELLRRAVVAFEGSSFKFWLIFFYTNLETVMFTEGVNIEYES